MGTTTLARLLAALVLVFCCICSCVRCRTRRRNTQTILNLAENPDASGSNGAFSGVSFKRWGKPSFATQDVYLGPVYPAASSNNQDGGVPPHIRVAAEC
ncbi:hypothetical protein C8F01DRAFT_1122655 [Mycena amicta]|nr:hypothetical protein C8F01DRAFT_1122655 [Mycena amicta]